MKHILTYEDFLNESISAPSISPLIDALKLIEKNVSIDAAKFIEFREIFINSIRSALKQKSVQLDTESKNKLETAVEKLVKPIEGTKNLTQFISAITKVSGIKDDISDEFSISESLNESKIMDWFKKAKTATVEWWQENKQDIFLFILEMIAQFIVNFLFALINALFKKDDNDDEIEAPKISFRGFGGGRTGGGGAGAAWD
jgi:hypothetical protein